MTNIINGYSFPRFRILNSSNELIQEIDLDVTNSDGFVESYADEDYTHILEKDKEIKKVYIGERITFTLHYNDFVYKDNALKIQTIRKYEKTGFKIILIPRSDVLGRNFQVVYTGESELGINKGGEYANTNRLIEAKWVTKKVVDRNWLDSNDLYATFQNFAVV